jgi:L-glyceraldehyde 3-phosphate reductase
VAHFGGVDTFENYQAILRCAFDLGITHFDLANNYGPPPVPPKKISAAFSTVILPLTATNSSSAPRLDTPCGPAPTAIGARANMLASLNQSLKREVTTSTSLFPPPRSQNADGRNNVGT